jgi:hypothetical protein
LRGVACRQEGALRPLFLEGFAPDVGVVAGALEFWPRVASLQDIAPLDAVLKIVQAVREQSSSIEARRDRLRKEAPDLAGLVDDERMSENEAIAALDERKRKDAQRRLKNRRY